jgi:DNA-binding CsgD family transcriptional regulator
LIDGQANDRLTLDSIVFVSWSVRSDGRRFVTTELDKRTSLRESNGHHHEAALPEVAEQTGMREVGSIELGGKLCRVLVDAVAARRMEDRGAAQVPTCTDGEPIVRFVFEGQHYALVTERPRGADGVATRDVPEAIAVDITRLLSRREMEVVQLVCMGFLTKQIAGRLQISEFTVRTYVKTIYAKLGVRSRGALVYRFMKAMNGDGAGGGNE